MKSSNYHQIILAFLMAFFPIISTAQSTQNIRGIIIDKLSETPLIGANIIILPASLALGATSDNDGSYVIKNVPQGRHEIQISYIGYKTVTIPNVLVNVGKETVLDLGLEENITMVKEVTVTSKLGKSEAINELAMISARQFNVEEVQRYSGGRNDVSRLAANFAGVVANNDSRNDIVIRGNSPTGVLWRLEGIPIPSPNHFATLGTTGGPVSALNPNLIKNSDFLTSAFPAEYGNALAGVFDIGFRNGNKDKFEFTAQLAAFSGFEAMVEGPLRKGKGSFVISYRHSFVELANVAGINFGTSALPKYKDLNFNFDFGKTKLGRFSIFGIGALSNIDFIGADLKEDDFYAETKENSFAKSQIGLVGVKHNVVIDNSSYIRTVLSASNSGNTFNSYRDENNEIKRHVVDLKDYSSSYRLNSYYNKKFNAKWGLRSGILVQSIGLDTDTRTRQNKADWAQLRQYDSSIELIELYAQSQYKPTERITLIAGLHSQQLVFNDSKSLEPRVSAAYKVNARNTLTVGYGLHSQTQPLPILFFQERQPDGSISDNTQLGFSQSNQFVVGHDFRLTDWHTKFEVYYQLLSNVPVERNPSSYSVLNTGADFGFPQIGNLENAGTGNNYGLELTVEKYFNQNWYMLFSGSLFESKYEGSDNITRNTAFNNRYIVNLLAGREIKFGKNKQNFFSIDSRVSLAGGRNITPIDLASSVQAGEEILDESKAFGIVQDAYFRWDVKFGVTFNSSKRKLTQQFFLDFQNVTNNKNIFQERFSASRGESYKVYQIGFFPDLLWRFQF